MRKSWALIAWFGLAACPAPTPANLLTLPDGAFVVRAALDGGVPWSAALCQPLDEEPVAGTPSALVVSGACSFTQRALAECRARGDDFYVVARRRLAGGRLATIYINVESFRGPGEYDEAQTHAWIGEGTGLYRWSEPRGHVTLGAGGDFSSTDPAYFATAGITTVTVPDIVLDAERGTLTSGELRLSGQLRCLVRGGPEAFTPLAP